MEQKHCEREECVCYIEDDDFLDDSDHPVSNCTFDKFVNFDPDVPCPYYRLDWKKASNKK